MNTYFPVRKIIKAVSTQRCSKRERHASLQECLESVKDHRRRRWRWKPWGILVCLSAALLYFTVTKHLDKIYYEKIVEQELLDENYAENLKTSSIDTPHNVSATTEAKTPSVKYNDLPFCIRRRLHNETVKALAKFHLNLTSVNISQENVFPGVLKGGSYHPPECRNRFRVGIVVPYRNREQNLGIFLNNIHPFLMRQKLEYQIFVIEQDGNDLFNKGRLFNAGYKEMMKFNKFFCVIFHDLDLLPLDENIMYNCPTLPRHMCAHVNDTDIRREFNITYSFKSLFGGVVSMTMEQFNRANGFSNLYFGWGAEDNDMFWRLHAAGYPVVRYQKSVGTYLVLPHKREPANPYRFHLLSRAVERYKQDGLSNLEYYVLATYFRPLCTHIVVDINPRDDNITALNLKWGKSYHKF